MNFSILSPQTAVDLSINPIQVRFKGIDLPARLCNMTTEGFVTFTSFRMKRNATVFPYAQLQQVHFTLVNGSLLAISFVLRGEKVTVLFDNVLSGNPQYISSEANRGLEMQCIFTCSGNARQAIRAVYSVQTNQQILREQEREQFNLQQTLPEDYKNLRNALSNMGSFVVFYPNGIFEVRYKVDFPPREVVAFKGNYKQQSIFSPVTMQHQQQAQTRYSNFAIQQAQVKTVDARPPAEPKVQDPPKSAEPVNKDPKQQIMVNSMDLSNDEDLEMTLTENSETVEEQLQI